MINDFDRIPQELRELRQWVVVRADSKIPLNARTGFPASSSNPFSWSSFEDARLAVASGFADNIGFVFRDNGIVGIDIDKGFRFDGEWTPEAVDIIQKCQSYTEVSRSGRGFHILVKGSLPFKGKNNRNGIEIYRDARYFIMTGDVGQYTEIIENQEAIDYVVKKYFPDTERESRAGTQTRVYCPKWEKPEGERIRLRPVYPRIPEGCRNICLTSLAGILHSQGYEPQQIFDELCYANLAACNPPLDEGEVESIVRSVIRYRRG